MKSRRYRRRYRYVWHGLYLGRICIIVAHMSRVCQPRSHLNLKLACRGGMFSQERSFDEVRILLQIKIIYTGDIV